MEFPSISASAELIQSLKPERIVKVSYDDDYGWHDSLDVRGSGDISFQPLASCSQKILKPVTTPQKSEAQRLTSLEMLGDLGDHKYLNWTERELYDDRSGTRQVKEKLWCLLLLQPPENLAAACQNAAGYNCSRLLQLLLRVMRKLEVPADQGLLNQSLIDAASRGASAVVTLLLKAGASVDATEPSGQRSALHVAAAFAGSNAAVIIDMLLEGGADVSVLAADGSTPLHYAAQSGSARACEILSTGAGSLSLSHMDTCGRTPLRIAISSQAREAVCILKAAAKRQKKL